MNVRFWRAAVAALALSLTIAPLAGAFPVPTEVTGNLPPEARAVAHNVPGVWISRNVAWEADPAGGSGFALKTDTTAFPFGYASLRLPAGMTIDGITALSLDTFFASGNCGWGAPRIQLAVDTDGDGVSNGNVHVYAGAYPNFNTCAPGAWETHDMLDGALRWDSTQLGGPFYGTQADAAAAAGAGHGILRATVVHDGPPSVVYFDDVRVECFVLGEPTDAAASVANGQTGC